MAELDAKLYSGAVTVPRELQAMQTEGDAMRRAPGRLEDEVLEAMGERETLDEQVAELERRRDELDAAGRPACGRRSPRPRPTSTGSWPPSWRPGRRRPPRIPADVAALYEQLRARLDGVAAAPLVNGRCGGCHLALPATEIDRLRKEPADTLVRCEQCERILVRP